MKSSSIKLVVPLLLCVTCDALGQSKVVNEESPITKIGQNLFDNTVMNPRVLRNSLSNSVFDSKNFEKLVQDSIDYFQHQDQRSSFINNGLKNGELVSFQIRNGKFFLRAISKKQWRELSKKSVSELPSDLKAKRVFQVAKVSQRFVVLTHESTSLTIPAARIVYVQRGTEPFFK